MGEEASTKASVETMAAETLPPKKRSGCGWGCLGAACLYALTCAVFVAYFLWLGERQMTKEVNGEPPPMFPVLLVWGDAGERDCSAVYHKDLEQFTAEHPGCGFLVPKGEDEALSKKLDGKCRWNSNDFSSDSPLPWSAGFKVLERLPDGSQRLEVHCAWDDDRVNIGWYRAEVGRIVPERHRKYFGPGVAMGAFFMGVGLATLGWIVVLVLRALFNVFARMRQRSGGAVPSPSGE